MLKHIDHLIITVSDLKTGMDYVENLLGVRPIIGGRHPKLGTHNALVSLGETIYLEIVAPDPELAAPERGRFLEGSFDNTPKLATWVMRTEEIEALASHTSQHGLDLGEVQQGKRETPDGKIISWKLTDPYEWAHDGAIPFLISWGDTPHPASTTPIAGEFINLIVESPEPEQLKKTFNLLGVNIEIKKAAKLKLTATVNTDKGIITIE
jgi:hypothetical protein